MIRINRAGRPRKTNVIRDSSDKSRGEVLDLSLVWKQPHRRDCADPASERAAFPLGRLRLNGLLTEPQFRAGCEYASVVAAYGRAMGLRTGNLKSGSMAEYIARGPYEWETDFVEPDPEEANKRLLRVRAKYDKCHEDLFDLGRLHNRGRNILFVMREICIQEAEEKYLWHDAQKLGDLRLGLNAVHRILLEKR